ncbi:hypothetical protein ACS15_4430 [Ralstonia insidiosa]|uniref:Uncharacterized protein n=1 Tax=Ralstonia insidiosa TaxID=190721 RepID=A0AAC9BN56_9RALS|nr:hypothetical protein ACS15_4430 [Ralstonia insidiosa]
MLTGSAQANDTGRHEGWSLENVRNAGTASQTGAGRQSECGP